MNILNELEVSLKEAKDNGEYWEKGIPDSMMKMDIELNKIINKCILLSKEEKELVDKSITTDIAWLLLCFAINMATYSLRTSKQEYFYNGLTALGMVLEVLDQREILLVMPLFYDVHKRNKLSFETILNRNDEFATFLRDFLRRDDKNKSLGCMGYILTRDENNNLFYKRIW